MQLEGVTQTPANNRFIVGQKFGGDIFNSPIGGGIYLLNFALNINSSRDGNQVGLYALSTREILRVFCLSECQRKI